MRHNPFDYLCVLFRTLISRVSFLFFLSVPAAAVDVLSKPIPIYTRYSRKHGIMLASGIFFVLVYRLVYVCMSEDKFTTGWYAPGNYEETPLKSGGCVQMAEQFSKVRPPLTLATPSPNPRQPFKPVLARPVARPRRRSRGEAATAAAGEVVGGGGSGATPVVAVAVRRSLRTRNKPAPVYTVSG